jgi:hypothetical protein
MKENIMIRKKIVKKYLDTVVIKWNPKTDEFREDLAHPCKIKFNDDEYDAIFIQGHPCTGSPGTEEQCLLNASELLDDYWPENITKQTGGKTMRGWTEDRRIGISINVGTNECKQYPYPD